MKLILRANERGAGVSFGGVVHRIRNVAVARRMVAIGSRPAWRCKPHRGGIYVLCVDGPGFGLRDLVEPGDSAADKLARLSMEYVQWLEAIVRKRPVPRRGL